MTELFWRIDQAARVALIQYQGKQHKDKPKLDMAGRKAPWERRSAPVINAPDYQELEKMETERVMSTNSDIKERVK